MDPALTNRIKDLYRIQRKLDILNQEKSILNKEIGNYIWKHRLENKRFKIGDRFLSYKEEEQLQSFSQKYVNSGLKDYYQDPDEADQVYQYLLDNRKAVKKYKLKMTKK